MNQQLKLESNRTYDFTKFGSKTRVAFLGEKFQIHDEPVYILYAIKDIDSLPHLVVSHIRTDGFITDGRSISIVDHFTNVANAETIYGLDEGSLREDKSLLPLLSKLRQAGLEGVPQ